MGVLDKFLDVMRLNPEDEEDDFYNEDYYYDDDEEEEAPKKRVFRKEVVEDDDLSYSKSEKKVKDRPVKTTPKVTPMRSSKRSATGSMEVCVIKPTSFEDAREITETLLTNRTVVLNVEGLNLDIAQRIIDFTSGSTFAISGNLQKISNYIFIITPQSVDISGDFQDLMDSFDVSSIQSDF